MKDVLEGRKVMGEVPAGYWREYKLARLFGWTPAEIDAAPGHWCDWALEFADMEKDVRRG